ncbi:sugar isomerase [Clostridium perfringens]|nr:sugar isomerase [Clostridium perfringens]
MRTKKAMLNIIVSLIVQFISIICGLIVPRLIISSYGSDINGLIASINQFLSYIVLLEAGVGGVVRAALYKPLSKKDNLGISKILIATEKFFRKVAYIFILYLIFISLIFPYIVHGDNSYFFTFSLVIIIGVSTFFQYYFGISYQILLQSDQKQYINASIQIITITLNTIFTVLLIKFGASIQTVKLVTSFIFIIRPIILNIYVIKKYKIIKNCDPDNKAISQRWDGLGHHIAFLIHNNTDIILLTLFSNVNMVSVYSVYFMIVSSVKTLVVNFSVGLEAALGDMIAKNENEKLKEVFGMYEILSFSITTIIFTSTVILILPFISIYTSGIKDANYYRPIFAYILILSQAMYCIRVPYKTAVLAAGHYKETKKGEFIEAGINIGISILLVNKYGITGVVIGTVVAVIFRTIQYAYYLSNNMLSGVFKSFIKKILIYLCTSGLILLIIFRLDEPHINSYFKWGIYSIFVVVISTIITSLVSLFFYKNEIKNIIQKVKEILIFRKKV